MSSADAADNTTNTTNSAGPLTSDATSDASDATSDATSETITPPFAALTSDERALIEELAAACHASWARWTRYLLSLCEPAGIDRYGKAGNGDLRIPGSRVLHWRMEIGTPYAALPEHLKQLDREEVMGAYLPTIRAYVKQAEDHIASATRAEVIASWPRERAGILKLPGSSFPQQPLARVGNCLYTLEHVGSGYYRMPAWGNELKAGTVLICPKCGAESTYTPVWSEDGYTYVYRASQIPCSSNGCGEPLMVKVTPP